MRDIPSITGLQAFEAAGRSLSFKHAAKELNLTAGAISRQIQTLEAAIGAPLFQRHHRRVELTPAGAAYLADIAAPLAALRAAGERARARQQAPVVSIVAYPTFAVRWLIPRWGRFVDAFPNIDLRLTTSLNPADFARGDADFAIRVADDRALGADVEHWKLTEIDLYPVAAPELAARLKQPEDLADAVLLHSAPRPADWPRWLAAADVLGVAGDKGLRFESLNLAYQAAIEGIGVAVGFHVLVADDLAAGRLAKPFEATRRSGRAMYLVRPAARAETPDAAVVRDWLLEEGAAATPPA